MMPSSPTQNRATTNDDTNSPAQEQESAPEATMARGTTGNPAGSGLVTFFSDFFRNTFLVSPRKNENHHHHDTTDHENDDDDERDFVSTVENEVVEEEEGDGDDEQESPIFATSLAQLRSLPLSSTAAVADTTTATTKTQDEQTATAIVTATTTTVQDDPNPNPKPNPNQQQRHTNNSSNTFTYQQWRNKERKNLMEYLSVRIADTPTKDTNEAEKEGSSRSSSSMDGSRHSGETTHGEDDIMDDELDDDDDDKEEESMMMTQSESQGVRMETQEPYVVVAHTASNRRKRKRQQRPGQGSERPHKQRSGHNSRRSDIPNIQTACVHDVSKLEYLDLYTQTFSLPLARIVKTWKLRETTQHGDTHRRAPSVVELSQGSDSEQETTRQLGRIVYGEREETGPLGSIYHKVLQLEVEQLPVLVSSFSDQPSQQQHEQELNPLRIIHHQQQQQQQQYQNPNQPPQHNPQRMNIFLYDSYAIAVSEWIEEQQQKQVQQQQRNKQLQRSSSNSKRKKKHGDSINGGTNTNDAQTDQATTTTIELVMQLSKIPAVCIFPYTMDPRNWRGKQDLVEYCLGIGAGKGTSTVSSFISVSAAEYKSSSDDDSDSDNDDDDKSNKSDTDSNEKDNNNDNNNFDVNDTHTTTIRFDSDDMLIRLMAVKRKVMTRSAKNDNNDSSNRSNNNNTTTTNTVAATGTTTTTDVDIASELILSSTRTSPILRNSTNSTSSSNDRLSASTNTTSVTDTSINNVTSTNTSINPLQESWKSYMQQQQQQQNESNDEENIRNEPSSMDQQQQQRNNDNNSNTDVNGNERGLLDRQRKTGHQLSSSTNNANGKNQQQDHPIQRLPLEPMAFVGTSKRHQSNTQQLKYEQLGDIRSILDETKERGRGHNSGNVPINVYGVVQGSSPPRMTKRGDWMISVTIIDESICFTGIPIILNIFCKHQHELPKIAFMGDILRVHRAKAEIWKSEVQLTGLKSSSFAVIRRTEDKEWKVFPTSNSTFTFNRSDEEVSQNLWYWAQRHIRDNSSIKSDERCFTLASMSSMKDDEEKLIEDRDITVMVVERKRYTSQPSGNIPQGYLRVWDGSGYPPSDPLFMKSIVEQSTRERMLSHSKAVERVTSVSQQLQITHFNMLIPPTLCGRISNVAVWEKSHWNQITEHVTVGTFLRLRNVHIRKWQGNTFRSIFLHDRSWLTVLPYENFEVRSLLLKHNDRVKRGDYNREFGLHPNFKFAGNGLSEFKNQENIGIFTGAIHLLESSLNKNDMRVVVVGDRSGSLEVMIGKKMRTKLESMTHVSDNSFDPSKRFLASIRSFNYESRRVFVLANIAPCD